MAVMVWGDEMIRKELIFRTWDGMEEFNDNEEPDLIADCDLFLDLDPLGLSKRGFFYSRYPLIPILANTVECTLKYFWQSHCLARPFQNIFGLNAWPTLLGRPLAEVTVLEDSSRADLDKLMEQLNWPFRVVPDQVGMVVPRVIAMIINEAYYTLQDGTATKSAIDMAMKLGTQYPFGPFEWGQCIGLDRIYRLITNLKKETHDPRYQVCPLLEKEYLDLLDPI